MTRTALALMTYLILAMPGLAGWPTPGAGGGGGVPPSPLPPPTVADSFIRSDGTTSWFENINITGDAAGNLAAFTLQGGGASVADILGLDVYNSDDTASGELTQTGIVRFSLNGSSNSGTSWFQHVAAEARSFKLADWWGADEGDFDAGIRFLATHDGVLLEVATMAMAGPAAGILRIDSIKDLDVVADWAMDADGTLLLRGPFRPYDSAARTVMDGQNLDTAGNWTWLDLTGAAGFDSALDLWLSLDGGNKWDAGGTVLAGALSTSGTITSAATNAINWSLQTSPDQACNNTCNSGAVFGWDTGTGNRVGPADVTADECLCAGPS